MRIDAHVTFQKPTYLPEVLWPRLESNRFDGCIAVQPEPDFWVLDFDFVRGAVLRISNLTELDEAQRNSKFRGVSSQGEHSLEFFRELERRNLTAEINTDPQRLGEIFEAVPDLRVVTLARPGLPLLNPNLYVKLAGLTGPAVEYKPLVEEMLDTFGPERILFGSNWPECRPWKLTLATFTQALGPRTMEVRSEMLGGTAARAYGLV